MNSFGYYMFTLIILVFLSLVPGNIAAKKGYSFAGFYLFSFCFFLPSLIVALCLTDRNLSNHQTNTTKTNIFQPELNQSSDRSNDSLANRLLELKKAYEQGILSEEEYNKTKDACLTKFSNQ